MKVLEVVGCYSSVARALVTKARGPGSISLNFGRYIITKHSVMANKNIILLVKSVLLKLPITRFRNDDIHGGVWTFVLTCSYITIA